MFGSVINIQEKAEQGLSSMSFGGSYALVITAPNQTENTSITPESSLTPSFSSFSCPPHAGRCDFNFAG